MKKFKCLAIIISLLAMFLIYSTDIGIPFQARVVLAIMVFAGIMWIAEALPLHATGLFVALLLATMGGFSGEQVFSPFFDPIIALLLGGFVLAVAMQKHGLDRLMALRFLNRVGSDPKFVLLGMMCMTAFMSFWITNTASTLVMLPIAISILAANRLSPLRSRYGKAMVLGVAFAATIGGVGTIIGSTPNAMAVKFLADQGIVLSFLDWMLFGLPMVIVMLPVIWLVLLRIFRPEVRTLNVERFRKRMNRNQKTVFGIFILTVLLWLTTYFHGVSSSVVALVPIVLLYVLSLLDTDDFSRINWAALILFGSGLSLGSAIHASGLDSIMASSLGQAITGQPLVIVLLAIIAVGIGLTAVASNTAAAAIFVPIIIPFAVAFGIDIKLLAVLAAMAVSVDFILPIGTPPSTVAYASGYVRIRDMAKAGVVLSVIASLVLVGLFFLW